MNKETLIDLLKRTALLVASFLVLTAGLAFIVHIANR